MEGFVEKAEANDSVAVIATILFIIVELFLAMLPERATHTHYSDVVSVFRQVRV